MTSKQSNVEKVKMGNSFKKSQDAIILPFHPPCDEAHVIHARHRWNCSDQRWTTLDFHPTFHYGFIPWEQNSQIHAESHAEVKGKANQVITNSTQCTNAARSKLTDSGKRTLASLVRIVRRQEDGLKTSAHQAILWPKPHFLSNHWKRKPSDQTSVFFCGWEKWFSISKADEQSVKESRQTLSILSCDCIIADFMKGVLSVLASEHMKPD